MICSWFFKSVLPSIAQSVMHMDKAKDIWNDLHRRFSQRDPHRISLLQNEIYNLKQGGLSVNDYYTKCRTLWEEMNALRPLPICKCRPRCCCDLMDEIRKDREIDQIIRFLQGLNDDYNSLKSGVLVLDPLPEMDKVFVMAEKLERQLSIANLTSNGGFEFGHANTVQTGQNSAEDLVAAINLQYGKKYPNTGGGNRSAKCTYCGMSGHTIEKCYKNHGYPPGWVPGYKSRGKQSAATSSAGSNNGLNPEQLQKLISILQGQMGQVQQTSTSAAVALTPKFSLTDSHNRVSASEESWEDEWFC